MLRVSHQVPSRQESDSSCDVGLHLVDCTTERARRRNVLVHWLRDLVNGYGNVEVVCVSCRHDLTSMRQIPSGFARSSVIPSHSRSCSQTGMSPDNLRLGMYLSRTLKMSSDACWFHPEGYDGHDIVVIAKATAGDVCAKQSQRVSGRRCEIRLCQSLPDSRWPLARLRCGSDRVGATAADEPSARIARRSRSASS